MPGASRGTFAAVWKKTETSPRAADSPGALRLKKKRPSSIVKIVQSIRFSVRFDGNTAPSSNAAGRRGDAASAVTTTRLRDAVVHVGFRRFSQMRPTSIAVSLSLLLLNAVFRRRIRRDRDAHGDRID